MQREIKFRAWDTNAKEWVTDRITVGLKNEKSCPETEKDQVASLCVFSGQNNCIIMQFTGLHDKNRKEIYEGDILKWSNEYEDTCQEDCEEGFECQKPEHVGFIHGFQKGNVRYEDGGFVVDVSTDEYDKTLIGWAMDDCFTFEVIGNIHENPDLLT